MQFYEITDNAGKNGKDTYIDLHYDQGFSYSFSQEANMRLLSSANKNLLQILSDKFGLKKNIIQELKIGIDEDNNWIFPLYKYETQLFQCIYQCKTLATDFKNEIENEERQPLPSLIAINSYSEKTESIILVKDYIDGCVLQQYLSEIGKKDFFHIVTTNYGRNCLLNLMSEIDFQSYQNFYIFVGNDEIGEKLTKRIIKEYPMFKKVILFALYESFKDAYFDYYSIRNE